MTRDEIFPYEQLICVEASLKQLSPEQLKKLYFKNLDQAIVEIYNIPGIVECVILQKCNCIEIYIVLSTSPSDEIVQAIREKWEKIIGSCLLEDVWRNIQFHYGKDVIHHLYRVTSSLESLIIGDNQVFSQVNTAYNFAVQQGTVKDTLSHIFKEAFGVARMVRSDTNLHGNGVSIGRAAATLLIEKFPTSASEITIAGSGQISDVIINAMRERWKYTKIDIITQRSEFVDRKYENPLIKAYSREELLKHVTESEAVIFCTNSNSPLIKADDLKNAVEHGKLKCIIDLGMPPNVDTIEDSDLIIYSLSEVVEYGKKQYAKRLEEAKQAEKIIDQSFNNFEKTIIEYKRNKILRELGPAIHKEMQKKDAESSIMGLMIRVFKNLDIDELDAIDVAIQNVSKTNDLMAVK